MNLRSTILLLPNIRKQILDLLNPQDLVGNLVAPMGFLANKQLLGKNSSKMLWIYFIIERTKNN